MALEPGIYCVYNAPGGPMVDASGLPGVRISAAPGAGRGLVSVATFTDDGWIGADSAALVRVTKVAADLLVTVYQAPDSTSEAPKLQVVRLSGEVAPAPPVIAAPEKPAVAAPVARSAPAPIEVVAHIYGRGDIAGPLGESMGEAGSQRWIEGFGVAPSDGVALADIEYQAVLGRGWLSPWSEGGQFCGSRGMSLPILGLRIRLRGAAAKTHRVVLKATFVDGTAVGPVGDGEACEAPSLAALESFHLTLEPVASAAARKESPKAAAAASSGATAKAPAGKKPMPAKRTATTPIAKAAPKAAVAKAASAKALAVKPAAGKAAEKPAAKPGAKAPAKAAPPKPIAAIAVTPPKRTPPKRTPATTRRR